MAESKPESYQPLEELRLFPLNVVLFPGSTLPLRIFEERYKLMIGECLEESAPFGVVLIREGREIGGPASPYRAGTTARITQVEKLEDGRMNLSTVGDRRFRIVDTIHQVPYLKGTVGYLQEGTGDIDAAELARAGELFTEYVQALAGLRSGWLRQPDVPEDATALSYLIADHMELPSNAKQRLLELPVTGERLHYEIPLLEGAVDRVRQELLKRNPYQGPRLN